MLSLSCLVAMSAAADQPVAAAAGETVSVIRSGSGMFTVHVTDNGGAVKAIMLGDKQFDQKADEPPAGSVIPPDEKLAAGPLDIVTTWDNQLLPLVIEFEQVSPLAMGRIVLVPPPAPVPVDPVLATPPEGPAISAQLPAQPAVVAAATPEAAPVAPAEPPVPVYTTEPVDFWTAFNDHPVYKIVSATADSVVMVWPDPAVFSSPLYIERTYTVREDYVVAVTVRLVNLSLEDISGQLKLSIPGWESPAKKAGFCGGMFGAPPDVLEAVCSDGKDFDRKNRKEILDAKNFEIAGKASYAGVASRYFLTAVIPEEGSEAQCVAGASELGVVNTSLRWGNDSGARQMIKASRDGSCIPEWLVGAYGMEGRVSCTEAAKTLGVSPSVGLVELSKMDDAGRSPDAVAARQSLMNRRDRTFSFTMFGGPKDMKLLKSVSAGLEDTINFGWFWFLARPMLSMMKFTFSLIPSWGLAIFLLTIVVKLITTPLTITSTRQMRRMAELKPRIDELQKKFKGDKEKINQATMELYKREKINPMGGCLPMLVQMPIWIALYRTIYSAVDLYQAPLGLWIRDLSAQDPYFVLPILLGGAMFLNQKMTPVTGDPTQAKIMLWMMPIMFTGMMLFLPSGLVFYILVNTILSILQTLWTNRGLNKKLLTGA